MFCVGRILYLQRFSQSQMGLFGGMRRSRRPGVRYIRIAQVSKNLTVLSYPSSFLSISSQTSHANATTDCELDPFNYTTGRWLRRDAQERAARCIRFDFDALCRRVVALCPGATAVTGYSKKEGGFNRIFVFHTDNAKRVVARLPFAVAGPRRLTTASEVATIRFCRFSRGYVVF